MAHKIININLIFGRCVNCKIKEKEKKKDYLQLFR